MAINQPDHPAINKDARQQLGQGVGARAIHDRLRLEVEGFAASYSAVKRMVRQLRKAQGVR
ncbi:hypothetical protein D7X55_42770, partial [Corallococcus sp. AB049A]|uniref:hypothetical protein n=1 Tax=Corallococcus sp. AB049A TaxID=2316721 RepID=UPI000EE54974